MIGELAAIIMLLIEKRSMAVLSPRALSRWASLAKKALGTAAVMGVLGAGQAQALVVTVDNQLWDVTTFEGTYNNNVSLLQNQEWWGSQATAEKFASAVGDGLNFPNFFGTIGPYFAFGVSQVNLGFIRFNLVNSNVETVLGVNTDLPATLNANLTWAAATKVAAPSSESVPGPLPILGVAAAFGFSRKLRKRIKLHRDTIAISTSTGA
ncbi:MAG: hypothetical protein VKK63_00075 [Synechococcus sp.]|nr:hypothetical protein [Synechococcus sp.]